jgi:transcriptional regulator with XRE-family HTH domain
MTKKKPGTLIKQARNSLRLTQRDLASMVGVKASHIAYIENGQRNPSLSLLRRLADDRGTHSTTRKADGWHEFSSNQALLQRHQVTPAELKVLRQVNSLGPVSEARNFLFILNSIRMAASSGV